MKMRAPAVPLITVDPYFSVWSMANRLNDDNNKHWTGHPHRITGTLYVDGKEYCFMDKKDCLKMEQTGLVINALSSKYSFECLEVKLDVTFTTPLLLDDLKLMSRPVSYINVKIKSNDGNEHKATVKINVDDELCLNFKYEFPTIYTDLSDEMGFACGKVGSKIQRVLNKCGDDLRINWGYLYLASNSPNAQVKNVTDTNRYGTVCNNLELSVPVDTTDNTTALFAIAYDDIKSIEYFKVRLDAYWKKDGETIEDAIKQALNDYDSIYQRCEKFAAELYEDAVNSGNEKYAELLSLAYRQSIAAHKLCVDTEGNILFISKENFSNGCAATVDVTYPSIPLYLIYNPELVKGMLRPIFKYASSDVWFYDFAPHDAGTYPLVNGQVYSHGTCSDWQMPVEECGNMLICTAAVTVATKDVSFAKENWELLEKWCKYLIDNGVDPDNQLCTDDFAGHLAHNCNLSIKAIMGIASFAILNRMDGNEEKYNELMQTAKSMAEKWIEMAANGDGTFRLAFDRPGTFSMKYNAVWDKIFGLNIFPAGTFKAETKAYIERFSNRFGLLLDNRERYTKADWVVWSATLCDSKEDFTAITDKLWRAYDESESRVPMTDWYSTVTAKQIGFQNRSVIGGLFIKLLHDKGICKVK